MQTTVKTQNKKKERKSCLVPHCRLILFLCFYPQSFILPVFNASCWLEECLQGIVQQDFSGSMELSVFDDASTVRLSVFECTFTPLYSMYNNRPATAHCILLCVNLRMIPGWWWRVGGTDCNHVASH